MYLSMVNEEHRVIFLELAYQVALIDNDFSEKEQVMIESYCNEMGIVAPEVIRARSIDGIIESMKSECTILEKRIMVFELLGLALVDGKYDEFERKIIEEIMGVFRIDESFAGKSENILKEYIEIQNRMNTLVLG